jgi:hypothetical protein
MLSNLEKERKKLDIYIIDCRQSIVLVKDDIYNSIFLNEYISDLSRKEKIVYIDFKNIHSAQELAQQLLEQYIQLFNKAYSFKFPQDTYYAVSNVLELFTKEEEVEENIVIWMDNFTDILSLQEHDWLFGPLRSSFQHHQNIVHVFTSDSREKVNSIFMNSNNPFFRFARIV